MDLTIILLNWNTCDLLRQALLSIKHSQPGIKYEIIVVDNASEDKSREMVVEEFPEVTLLVSKRNVGFAAGNNLALPQAKGRYILFLNSDTQVVGDALDALVRCADAAPDIGILGPKLLNADGSLQYSCRHYPNLATGFFRNTPLGRLFPGNKYNSDYLMTNWDHAALRDVDWVSGAAIMMRRELIEQIGSFDDSYYMYCEDVDICQRATLARFAQNPEKMWRVVYYPESVIYHYIGRSSDKAPARMTYEFHRSQYIFYRKHYMSQTPFWLRPIIPLGIGLRATGQILRFRVRRLQRQLQGKKK